MFVVKYIFLLAHYSKKTFTILEIDFKKPFYILPIFVLHIHTQCEPNGALITYLATGMRQAINANASILLQSGV